MSRWQRTPKEKKNAWITLENEMPLVLGGWVQRTVMVMLVFRPGALRLPLFGNLA